MWVLGAKRELVVISIVVVLFLSPATQSLAQISDPVDVPAQIKKDGFEGSKEINGTDPMLKIGTLVQISTNWGNMVLGMYEVGAPITTSNFLNLTRSGFYNGISFHRIIDDFVIQTGDPNTKDNNPYNDGWGGSAETIPLEVSENLTHIDGAVGMARSSDPDSASSQFYICDTPQHGLDMNYSVFAVVVEGMDTVRKIASAPTYGNKRPLLKDHPVDDIIMQSVSISGVWNNDTDSNVQGSFPVIRGLSVGLGGFLFLGLGLIVLVVAVFLVRKGWKVWMEKRDREDVLEAELVEEVDGGKWGRSYHDDRDWYDD